MERSEYTVLVAGSDGAILDLIKESLIKTHGSFFEVESCKDIHVAVEEVIFTEPDCLVLNLDTKYGLPQEIYEKIYILTQHCPVIALIDNADSHLEALLFENGVAECLIRGSSLWERLSPHLFHAIKGWNDSRKAMAWSQNRGRFIEYIPAATVLISEDGLITDMNQAGAELFGFSSDDAYGYDFSKLFLSEASQPAFIELLSEVKFAGRIETIRTSLMINDVYQDFNLSMKYQCDDNKLSFYILMIEPVIHEDKTAGSQTVCQTRSRNKKIHQHVSVFLFDESSVNQVVMASHFEKIGISLDGAWNVNEFQRKCTQKKYDVCFLDKNTYDQTKPDPLEVIRKSNPNCKTVLICNSDAIVEKNNSFDEVVFRPVNHAQMVKLISTLTNTQCCADEQICTLVSDIFEKNKSMAPQTDELHIKEQVCGIVENLKVLVDKIAAASNEANIDMLRQLAQDLRNSCTTEEDAKNKASINALEHLVLSLITAKQIEQMRISADKLHPF